MTPEVREQVEELASPDALARGRAANQLGFLGAAAELAVPDLLAVLGDNRALVWMVNGYRGQDTTPGKLAAASLARIGKSGLESLLSEINGSDRNRIRHAAGGLATAPPEVAARVSIHALLPFLFDPHSGIHAAVVAVLGRSERADAVEPLIC